MNATAPLLVPSAHDGADLLSDLRLQTEQIVAGFLATASRQRHDLLGAGHSAGEQGKLT
ncbi:hypothetical protein [Mycolicibacterium sp. CH28]|uniref:hypothetical protein n=1 Tax=Mycolicibacterium sp. CH28 TaxID=2512237 RepID=UPI00138755E9|nr:hypothetical protein [Mycolicibacterium sp. CH28]